MISQAKERALRERMGRLGIDEASLVEKFVTGSGPGGQKINKTSNCVHLVHPPTGLEVQCQESRHRSVNRFLARLRLCDRIEENRFQRRQEQKRRLASARYRNRRRSAGEKRKLREFKKRRADRKKFRKRVKGDD